MYYDFTNEVVCMHNNIQFARTDKAIQNAMNQLLKSKPFEKITVQDILDETPVSRATFYKHYRDKYEIVEKMQEELLAAQELVVRAMTGIESVDNSEFLRAYSDRYRESMQSLLNVQTENVNLTRKLTTELDRLYRKNADGPYVDIEEPSTVPSSQPCRSSACARESPIWMIPQES